jgi:hypothetical protein
MAEVKGVLVSAMKAFLVDRYGKSAIDQALTTLDAKDASLIQKTFLDSSFYPYPTMVALRRLTRVLSASRPTTGDELGAFIAEYVFKGAYKPLLAKDPVTMVNKIGWVKDFFYRDTDRVEAAMSGDSSCVLVYRYEEGIRPTRGVCQSLAGFWRRTLELASGLKVAAATHGICIAEGADRCEFKFSW